MSSKRGASRCSWRSPGCGDGIRGSWSGPVEATLGNLAEAMQVLLGHDDGEMVRGRLEKNLVIDTLLPVRSWALFLGRPPRQADAAAGGRGGSRKATTTLVFVNMRLAGRGLVPADPRAQARVGRPGGAAPRLARQGSARLGGARPQGGQARRAVVATSSLDLGVDFLPVERVLQIVSRPRRGAAVLPAARRPQRPCARPRQPDHAGADQHPRAGRGRPPRGARRSPANIEKRATPDKPFDVLVQHVVTIALGGGFRADELFEEVNAWAYRQLTWAEVPVALAFDFVVQGGASLHAYPEYHRVVADAEGAPTGCRNPAIARRHKLCPSAPSSATRRCR